jgi:hypothetical protein
VRELASAYEREAAAAAQQQQPQAAAPAAAAAAAAADGKITLCVQLAADPKLKVRIALGDPISKLFDIVRQHMQKKGMMKAGKALRFLFDGDVLRGGETPGGLGMEDEDLVEVQAS